MKLALIAFTSAGGGLAKRLYHAMDEEGHVFCAPPALLYEAAGAARCLLSLGEWTAQAFAQNDGLIFVGACGIAVRAIAPLLADKLTDPAVVSVDEQGRFAVALTAGHVGGANRLASEIAGITGGQAVISTATDRNGRFAVDLFAQKNALFIYERALAKQVSAALLEGNQVGLASDFPFVPDGRELPDGLVLLEATTLKPSLGICISTDMARMPFSRTLHLMPRWLVLGAGCRKGVSVQAFEQAVLVLLERLRIPVELIGTLATLDRKQNEPCIQAFCHKYGIALVAATPDALNAQMGEFSASAFVQQTTGVDNVCERAAVWAGADWFLVKKQAADGITLALALQTRTMVF